MEESLRPHSVFRRHRENIVAHRPFTVQSGRFSYPIGQNWTRSSGLYTDIHSSNHISSSFNQGSSTFQKHRTPGRRAQSTEPISNIKIKQMHSTSSLSTFLPNSSTSYFPKPESWVQKQFFSLPASAPREQSVNYSTSWRSASDSRYVKHSQTELGRPSASWMGTVPPSQWPQESTRPNTGKVLSLTDPLYLQTLNAKILDALEGRPTLTITSEEILTQHERERADEEMLVRGLHTPHAGVREQLMEEILRQLQGDGPMEALQERLAVIDVDKSGRIGVKEFRGALNGLGENGVLQEKHYTFLLEQAGSRVESGRAVVQYNQFLELLRLARNRAMASLQKVTEVKKKGLMRWMHVRTARILKLWHNYAQSRRSRLMI